MSETEKATKLVTLAQHIYREPGERAALRCATSDAAALCDALVRDILAEHRTRAGNGPPTKRGQELAAIAKRCGDAIWAMREQITVPPNHAPVPSLED